MLSAAGAGKPRGQAEHSGRGAAIALDAGAVDVALAVAAHHAGLTATRGGPSCLKERVDRSRGEATGCAVRRHFAARVECAHAEQS